MDLKDADGNRIRKRVAKDRRTAERILREMERSADLQRAGLESGATNDCDVFEVWEAFRARRPLEDHEIKKLLDASPPHYRRIWTAFLATGLRKNELVELTWKDVDLERGLLRVRAETCKVKREDFIPIAPEFDAILHEVMPENPDPESHVFLNAAGRPWRNNLLTRFKSCIKAANDEAAKAAKEGKKGSEARGIDPKGLDIHSLRQTYGTLPASDPNNDVRTVMSLMRHSTVAMTMNLYVKPRAMRQREAMRTLDLATRGKEKAKDERAVRQVKTG